MSKHIGGLVVQVVADDFHCDGSGTLNGEVISPCYEIIEAIHQMKI